MIVCHCRVVSANTLDAAVAGGAVTLAAVCRNTGAGSECGSCVFAVKALLGERRAAGVRAGEAAAAPVAAPVGGSTVTA